MKIGQSGHDMGIDELRDQLTKSGFLKDSDGSVSLLKNWIAPSSSRAASLVCGSSQSGPREWTHETSGKSLRDWEKVQAESMAKTLLDQLARPVEDPRT
jgi:purine nucleoside permease